MTSFEMEKKTCAATVTSFTGLRGRLRAIMVFACIFLLLQVTKRELQACTRHLFRLADISAISLVGASRTTDHLITPATRN